MCHVQVRRVYLRFCILGGLGGFAPQTRAVARVGKAPSRGPRRGSRERRMARCGVPVGQAPPGARRGRQDARERGRGAPGGQGSAEPRRGAWRARERPPGLSEGKPVLWARSGRRGRGSARRSTAEGKPRQGRAATPWGTFRADARTATRRSGAGGVQRGYPLLAWLASTASYNTLHLAFG